MSTTSVSASAVITLAQACIDSIHAIRMEKDKKYLAEEMDSLRRRDQLLNKLTFGWKKVRSDEVLKQDAHNKLSSTYFYPDTFTSGHWLEKAKALLSLAKESDSGRVEVDAEDIVVLKWTKSHMEQSK